MHPANHDTTFGGNHPFTEPTQTLAPTPAPNHVAIETVVYKRAGSLDLHADIYLPNDVTPKKRPIGKDF